MLIIGLAGGSLPSRVAVARSLRENSRRQLVEWAVMGARLNDGRARTLARALDGLGEGRIGVEGLILTHVLTEQEAEVIRAAGGFVWHVLGPVSSAVVIRRDDLRVTEVLGGVRHWLDPLEALSEALLSKQWAA